jgi:hypothetical protein
LAEGGGACVLLARRSRGEWKELGEG